MIKKIGNYNFTIDENEFKKDVLEKLSSDINEISRKKTYFKISNINGIMRMDLGNIIDELNQIQFNPELIELENGSMIKITSETWLTAKGNIINKTGVSPTIEIELDSEYNQNPTDENDNQLQKAIEVLAE